MRAPKGLSGSGDRGARDSGQSSSGGFAAGRWMCSLYSLQRGSGKSVAVGQDEDRIPQGLKPREISVLYVRAEARTLQSQCDADPFLQIGGGFPAVCRQEG
jgi:hypothetical protein